MRITASEDRRRGRWGPEQRGKALFLIGESYRLLPEHLFWSLHGPYYDACIRGEPKSKQAQQCYEAYEESVLLAYAGNTQNGLPLEILNHLKELKGLAQPEKSQKETGTKPMN